MENRETSRIHEQIKEEIVDNILAGVYRPGDIIPGQVYYAEKYNVSRLTVRKAIDALVAKGILYTHKGKGTFVQEIATNTYGYRRLSGFSSNVLSRSVRVSSVVLGIQRLSADKRLSHSLQIPEKEPVVLIERLRCVNDICVSLQRSHLAVMRVGHINFEEEDLETGSLYRLLDEKANLAPAYLDEHFRAVACPAPMAEHFGINPGAPVLYITRIAYTQNDVPIEYCENYENSDVNGVWVKSVNID